MSRCGPRHELNQWKVELFQKPFGNVHFLHSAGIGDDVVWFALNEEDRPLFAFASIWTEFKATGAPRNPVFGVIGIQSVDADPPAQGVMMHAPATGSSRASSAS